MYNAQNTSGLSYVTKPPKAINNNTTIKINNKSINNNQNATDQDQPNFPLVFFPLGRENPCFIGIAERAARLK